MRIARVAHQEGVSFVALEGERDAPLETLQATEIAEHPFGQIKFTGRRWPMGDLRLLAPMLPTKVICIGMNYVDHVQEMGSVAPADPVIFLKPSTSVVGPGAEIKLPPNSDRVDYEGELAAVVGIPCKNVPAKRAGQALLGYSIANDVTARDQQRADGQWTRAKGYDTFCPFGPWIETDLDPSDLAIHTELDGDVKQRSKTSMFLHDVPTMVEWISKVMTLLPGDIILTGTPGGIGPMKPGQTVSVTVEGIGTLSNPVGAR